MSKWIRLKDKLPEAYARVLVLFLPTEKSVSPLMEVTARLPESVDGEPRFVRRFDGCNATHWMPLPELPEEVLE